MIQNRNIAICIVLTIVTCGIYGLYWLVCLANDVNTLAGTTNDAGGGMVLLLSIVTCGIYGFYWAYQCGSKIDAVKTSRGLPAGNGGILYLILFLFGGIIAYALIQNEINTLA